jgi:hypothetical protein
MRIVLIGIPHISTGDLFRANLRDNTLLADAVGPVEDVTDRMSALLSTSAIASVGR